MAQIGYYLMFFGAGSIALNLFDYEFSLLMWIDNWGTDVGWGIRIGAILIGALIWLVSSKSEDAESEIAS